MCRGIPSLPDALPRLDPEAVAGGPEGLERDDRLRARDQRAHKLPGRRTGPGPQDGTRGGDEAVHIGPSIDDRQVVDGERQDAAPRPIEASLAEAGDVLHEQLVDEAHAAQVRLPDEAWIVHGTAEEVRA